jgi:CHAT domain-containing protein
MNLGGDPASLAGIEVDRLIDHAESLLHRDTDRCAELLERAETAISGHRDLGRSARISEIRGEHALAFGELGDAATAYRHARRSWLAVGRKLEAVRATLGCTEVQVLRGEFEEAESAVLRVQAQLRREASHDDSGMARLDAAVQRQLADARAGMGLMAAAIRHCDMAENLYAALGDVDGMAMVNLRRGLVSLDAGLAHNAMIELNRARTASMRSDREQSAAVVVVLMAEALSSTGQVARALEVLDCVQPDLGGSRWHVAVHRLVRSNALLRAGLPAEAHSEARAAEEVFTQIGAVEYSARAALSCASASLRWGRNDVAAGELAVAERLFAECGSRLMRARTWLAQADLALAVGDLAAAHASCRRVMAAEIDESAPYLGVRARLMWTRVEEPAAASVLLDEAAELAARTGIPELRVDVLLARARHQRRLGHRNEAVDSLRSAILVGRAWERHLGDRGAGAVPSLMEATDELIALLLERDDHAGQIEAWRRARGAKWESLVPWAETTPGSIPPATAELRQQRLEELISDTQRQIGAGADGASEEALPPVPWGPLVEYYVTGEDVVAFVVRDGQVDARLLREVAAETRRLVSAWQQECRLMASGSAANLGSTRSSPALDGLYEMLLAPIADLLSDLDDELQVIGHRHLNAVPFDALLDEVGPWYSQLEGALRAPAEPAAPVAARPLSIAALVLAVPDENAPLITAEAEMIFRTLPSAEILLGGEATRDALVERARSADVVHFACHGVFRHENPLSSALRLGDGWLLARDIIAGSLGLERSVVVLSACGSGLSPDYVSEPIGLASACLAAGASGVVAALWAVDDAVTFKLMSFFYQALASGMEPPSALRHARRLVASLHPHPYYWAAFRYVAGGTSNPWAERSAATKTSVI